uniref:MADF domain-containing protein n=1 Tax=Caenorhabditis japonica TaxID=281687 RepID=A0A8R1EQ30_CAEJA
MNKEQGGDGYGRNAEEENWDTISDNDVLYVEEEEKLSMKRRGRKSKVKFSDEYGAYENGEIIDFIFEIEKHQIVWDPSHKDWHRNDVKKKVFMDIEATLKSFIPKWPRFPGRVAENLWKQLSKDYSSHIMRIRKAKSGSGVEDVASDFKFAEFLQFLNGPKLMRETKNSFVVGSREHQKMEIAVTPKRSATENIHGGAPKQAKKLNLDAATVVMQNEMEKTREMFAEVFGRGKNSECASERVCKVFKQLVENIDEIDRFEVEGKVVSFMCELRRQSSQSSSSSHFRPSSYASTQNSSHAESLFDDFDTDNTFKC